MRSRSGSPRTSSSASTGGDRRARDTRCGCPLRERVSVLRMLALYRSGRQAEALQAFRDTRSAFVDQLGIEPGAELQELHARILRQEAGLDRQRAGRRPERSSPRSSRALWAAGRPGSRARQRARARASAGRDIRRAGAGRWRARPGDAVRRRDAGPRPALRRAPRCLRRRPGPRQSTVCSPGFRRSCASARRPYQLIVTTAFDRGIEHAFADVREELDVVTYIAAGPCGDGSSTRPPGASHARSSTERIRRALAGATDGPAPPPRDRRSGPERTWESLVVTEDDHIDYPGPHELEGAIPVTLSARLRRSHLLFLGYDLADWNLRLVVNRLRGGRAAPYVSWAVRAAPTPLELAFWRRLDVRPSKSTRTRSPACSRAASTGWRPMTRQLPPSPYKGLRRSRTRRSTRCSSSAASATSRSSAPTWSPRG